MADIQMTRTRLIIILASALPGVVIISALATVLCRYQRRKARLFRRGITPICDEEIESWKVSDDEKSAGESSSSKSTTDLEQRSSPPRQQPQQQQQYQHARAVSVCSVNKPPSIIVYQESPARRASEDRQSGYSSSSPQGRLSLDMPSTPMEAFARAPNARPGLTDEMVPGDDAFIPAQPRRQARLSKHPPVSATTRHNRAWSTRSLSRPSHDSWYGADRDQILPPRRSTDTFTRSRSFHVPSNIGTAYSTDAKPPRASFDDEMFLGGLTPRPPIHKSEIGRAIG